MKASTVIKKLQVLMKVVGDVDVEIETATNEDWMEVSEVRAEMGKIVLHGLDLRLGE